MKIYHLRVIHAGINFGMTYLCAYFISSLAGLITLRLLPDWPFLETNILICACVVGLLTILNPLFKRAKPTSHHKSEKGAG